MSVTPESARARRYLLGDATEEESSAIEQDYLQHEEAVDRIAAAEDDLIEDYLADELDPADRSRFESAYLSVPHRRLRVETIRRLTNASRAARTESSPKVVQLPSRRMPRYTSWLALAASLLIVAAAAMWVWGPSNGGRSDVADATPPAPPTPTEPPQSVPAPRILAMTISPVAVRSAADSAVLVIPAATDMVALRLERETDARALTARRATIRTVGGRDVWQGTVAVDGEASPATAGRIDVPAASLPPDDYVVTLFGVDRSGREQEWTRYFLRVRGGENPR